MANRIYYKLQLVRVEYGDDAYTGGKIAKVAERGDYLKSNGSDVLVRGYASAITRAGELNSEIKSAGNWEKGWRFHIKEVAMEEQTNLFDQSAPTSSTEHDDNE